MNQLREKELSKNLEYLREQIERESDEITLPGSLTAKSLFEKMGEPLAPEDLVSAPAPKPASRRSIYLNFAVCAACFGIMFLGYWAVTRAVTGANITDRQSSAAQDISMDAGAPAPMMAAAAQAQDAENAAADDYTALYDSIVELQEANGIVFRLDGAVSKESGPKVNAALTGGSADMEMAAPAAPQANAGASGGYGVYQTNAQIAGIDESDIVKTDGTYLYQYRFDSETGGAEIAIVGATNLKKLSSIPLAEYTSAELYLNGNQLVLVQEAANASAEALAGQLGEPIENYITRKSEHQSSSNVERAVPDEIIEPDYAPAVFYPMTEAVIYDVSDHANPKEVRRLTQDGQYVSSRLYEDVLYLVTNKGVYSDLTAPGAKVNQMVPMVAESGEAKLLAAGDILIPPYTTRPDYAVVTAMDLKNQTSTTKAVLGMVDEVMMSAENLYLTSNQYSSGTPKTGVVRFSVKGTAVGYEASALLDGTIDGQFALDEHEGYLRVATTSRKNGATQNNVYVLDGALQTVGALENLAPGERIYSVRYLGDTGYVVTFRETDPLFVIDLSNPKEPKAVGQLKIPGFSEYLHPIDEKTLIGFGANTVATRDGGVVQDGLKLSLFDVSDPQNPKETSNLLLGNMGSTSPALDTHKAFLYYPEKKLIGFPATIYTTKGASSADPWSGERELTFSGYLVVKMEDGRFAVAGSLPGDETSEDGFERFDYDTVIERGLYIGDTLYTVSSAKLTAWSLDDYSKIGELQY